MEPTLCLALCHCSWSWRPDPECPAHTCPLPFTLVPPVSGLNCAELSNPLSSCSLETWTRAYTSPKPLRGHQESHSASLPSLAGPKARLPRAKKGILQRTGTWHHLRYVSSFFSSTFLPDASILSPTPSMPNLNGDSLNKKPV